MEKIKSSTELKQDYIDLLWQQKREIAEIKEKYKARVSILENRLNKKISIENSKARKARSRFLIKFGAEIFACFGIRFKDIDFLKYEKELAVIAEEINQQILENIRTKKLYYYSKNEK